MNIIRGNQLEYIPASHEDPTNPGSYKKVLARNSDLLKGEIQMINWALLPAGKSFETHFHQDMEEIFIIISGSATIVVGSNSDNLEKGDMIIIPPRATHQMTALNEDCEYLAIGISKEGRGKTINV